MKTTDSDNPTPPFQGVSRSKLPSSPISVECDSGPSAVTAPALRPTVDRPLAATTPVMPVGTTLSSAEPSSSPRRNQRAHYITVQDLPTDATLEELLAFFEPCGRIKHDLLTGEAKVKMHRNDRGDFTGYARVAFVDPESVHEAIKMYHGASLRGHVLSVAGFSGRAWIAAAENALYGTQESLQSTLSTPYGTLQSAQSTPYGTMEGPMQVQVKESFSSAWSLEPVLLPPMYNC